MVRAIYPGTFDPITNGHLDIIERASLLFDEVHVIVAINSKKQTLFSIKEREDLVRQCTQEWKNVRVSSHEGLTVEAAEKNGARVIIRGLRAVSDFEYEFQMALMNKKLRREVETLHLMSSEKFTYITSSLIRDLVSLGADVSEFVPALVEQSLKSRLLGKSP